MEQLGARVSGGFLARYVFVVVALGLSGFGNWRMQGRGMAFSLHPTMNESSLVLSFKKERACCYLFSSLAWGGVAPPSGSPREQGEGSKK